MIRLTFIGVAFVLLTACTSMFFVPDRVERLTPDRLGLQYKDVWLEAEDGTRLHAWHLIAEQRKGTVLFFHGNAQNVTAHIASVYWLPRRGFDVLMLDPRGYGRSEGNARIDGVHLDAEAALRYLAERACGEIIVFGQSLGGAIAIYTVAHSDTSHCVRGVVAEGAFSSYRRIAGEKLRQFWFIRPLHVPLAYLFSDDYSPERVIDRLSPKPLLVIQGENDGIVPPHHAQLLFEAARDPRDMWLLPKVGHIKALTNEQNRDRLIDWLVRVLGNERGPSDWTGE